MKTLKDGISKGIYSEDKFMVNGEPNFLYMFGIDRENSNVYDYLSELSPEMQRTYVTGVAFPEDKSQFMTGNQQISNLISYSINRWSKTLEDITMTKYGSSLVNNLIMQRTYPSYVSKETNNDNSNWFDKLDFRYISTAGWEKMTKVYTELTNEIDESLI